MDAMRGHRRLLPLLAVMSALIVLALLGIVTLAGGLPRQVGELLVIGLAIAVAGLALRPDWRGLTGAAMVVIGLWFLATSYGVAGLLADAGLLAAAGIGLTVWESGRRRTGMAVDVLPPDGDSRRKHPPRR